MRPLKVKYRHIDFDSNGTIKLAKHLAKTVAKHNYKLIQVDGRLYKITQKYVMCKSLGYLPIVYVDESLNAVYQDSEWYKNLYK